MQDEFTPAEKSASETYSTWRTLRLGLTGAMAGQALFPDELPLGGEAAQYVAAALIFWAMTSVFFR